MTCLFICRSYPPPCPPNRGCPPAAATLGSRAGPPADPRLHRPAPAGALRRASVAAGRPPSSEHAGPHPVVVAMHGGSWGSTYGKIVVRGVAAALARRGWAVWNIEYRRLGRGGGWPMTFEDVAAAVDHLAALDAPVDLARVGGLGHSAGGQLALWAAGRYKLPAGPRAPQPRGRISSRRSPRPESSICASAHARSPTGPVDALMGGRSGRGSRPVRRSQTRSRPVPLDLPVLLVHGADDTTVSVARSRAYAAAARAAGGAVELIELSGEAGAHRAHHRPARPRLRPGRRLAGPDASRRPARRVGRPRRGGAFSLAGL